MTMQTKDMRIDFELFDLCGTAGLVVNWSSDLAFCSLGENPRLPSAQWFAECIPSDTQQTTHLPSVKNKTLRKKTHSKISNLLSARQNTLGKKVKYTRQTNTLGKK